MCEKNMMQQLIESSTEKIVSTNVLLICIRYCCKTVGFQIARLTISILGNRDTVILVVKPPSKFTNQPTTMWIVWETNSCKIRVTQLFIHH